MGDPIDGLTATELDRWLTGRVSYERNFTEGEGLGPVFNQTSCGACHGNPLGGPGSITVTRAGSSTKAGFDSLEHLGGSLFHQEAISPECQEVVPPEANIVSNRVTNGVMGYGLVEAILDADLLALADPSDSDGDGVSGRAHMVGALEDPMGSPLHVGRFGWKAQDPTMMTFSSGAALNELGITNPLSPTENDPNGIDPPSMGSCDTVADPEEDMDFVQELADFQRFLAAPPQTPRSGMTGEAVFDAIGCATCHHASFTTPNDVLLEEALRNRTFQPYSDFLLHDMGLAADFIRQGDASEREMKTAPLAGVRRRDPLWHDGRFAGGLFADRITLAIEEHAALLSEGAAAAAAFDALSAADVDALMAFLDSLGKREFDADGDDVIDYLVDFLGLNGEGFRECFGGGPFTPDDPCAVHDVDQDGDVDGDDFDVFMTVYDDTFGLGDCDGDGVLDIEELLVASDDNLNGIPDDCCAENLGPSDINMDGAIDVDDIVLVVLNWGPCPTPCAADVNDSGAVDVDDIIEVVLSFGQVCP